MRHTSSRVKWDISKSLQKKFCKDIEKYVMFADPQYTYGNGKDKIIVRIMLKIVLSLINIRFL